MKYKSELVGKYARVLGESKIVRTNNNNNKDNNGCDETVRDLCATEK